MLTKHVGFYHSWMTGVEFSMLTHSQFVSRIMTITSVGDYLKLQAPFNHKGGLSAIDDFDVL